MPLSSPTSDINFAAFTPVVTPAATDQFIVQQIDGVQRIETRAQVHALEAGEHLILPQINEPLTPTLAFGDGNTGFIERVDNFLVTVINSLALCETTPGNIIRGISSDEPALLNETASDTNPTIVPAWVDGDTGVGWRTDDIGVLIAGGLNVMEFGEAGAAPLMGFYGTAAIALQTGVAVSSAGIHAALVNLGLITA